MSVGIPGLRIGSGPRGAYISGGAGGFRYRKSLGSSNSARRHPQTLAQPPRVAPSPGAPVPFDPNIIATIEHETKNVLELQNSSSDALLKSMNEQRNKMDVWPVVAAILVFALFVLHVNTPSGSDHLMVGAILVAAGVVGAVAWRDKMRKLTVLFYEPDATSTQWFDAVSGGLVSAANARKVKAVANTSRYADTKYSGGAAHGLKFADASLSLGQAPGIVANVQVPILKAGKTLLAFYPDRILAVQGKAIGDIAYSNLKVVSQTTKFIEAESVPVDARVVDRTWQYVNKKGGPDRRFKNNRELPVCAYNEFNLSTPDGLDVRFLGSREGGFDALAAALATAGRA